MFCYHSEGCAAVLLNFSVTKLAKKNLKPTQANISNNMEGAGQASAVAGTERSQHISRTDSECKVRRHGLCVTPRVLRPLGKQFSFLTFHF